MHRVFKYFPSLLPSLMWHSGLIWLVCSTLNHYQVSEFKPWPVSLFNLCSWVRHHSHSVSLYPGV